MRSPLSRLGDLEIGVATALAIVAVTIPLFLNPIWVSFEQGRARADAWTGFTPADLRSVTDSILTDLVVGPPDVDVAVGGTAVLNERERGHMRDVRSVFIGFFAVTLVAVAAASLITARRDAADRLASWSAIRAGSVGLIVLLVVAGAVALVAFDALFEAFHQLFFSGGSYTFDPATERLVQLFPFQFWQETAIAVGVVSVVMAAMVAGVATRRLARSADHPPVPATLQSSRP